MSNAAVIIENFAPWLTAVGAFVFGIMSHRRSTTANEHDRAQRAIEELHNIYHQLVADLGTQIDRLNAKNEDLERDNRELSNSCANLEKQVKKLTTKIEKLLP